MYHIVPGVSPNKVSAGLFRVCGQEKPLIKTFVEEKGEEKKPNRKCTPLYYSNEAGVSLVW